MKTSVQQNPAGIGDINGTAKGSGARFNAGKPDFSLVPLRLVAEFYRGTFAVGTPGANAVDALEALGYFQATGHILWLERALENLGDAGWAECAHVFSYGAQKYSRGNWMRGMQWSVPLACAARHLLAIIEGELTDAESGIAHRGHVFCNIVMLLTFAETYPEGNDLPTPGMLPAMICLPAGVLL